MDGVRGKEGVAGFGRAIEDDADVVVAGGVGIAKDFGGSFTNERRNGIAQIVEGLAEGRAPLLVPAGTAAGAAAVGTPALDAMGAAPGGVFDDPGFEAGRVLLEEFAVVGGADAGGAAAVVFVLVLKGVEHPGEGHFAVFVVVTVAFAVGGDVDELGAALALGLESAKEALGEGFAAVEQAFECDSAGAGAVVEEDGDAAAFFQADEVGLRGVNGSVGRFGPGRLGVFAVLRELWRNDRAGARALVRGEEDEADIVLGEEVEGFGIDGGFGEPHAFRHAAEAVLEVSDAPANLRDAVAGGGEGHDEVVVGLGHGRSVAGKAGLAAPIGMDDGVMDASGVLLQPGKQRRAEVEAHPGVVIQDADDLVLAVDDAGCAVRGVALGGNALVPVVPGGGGLLGFDGFEPRILARGLVEVSVDANGSVGHESPGFHRTGRCGCGRRPGAMGLNLFLSAHSSPRI